MPARAVEAYDCCLKTPFQNGVVMHNIDEAAGRFRQAGIDVDIRRLDERSGRIGLSSWIKDAEGVSIARTAFDEAAEIIPRPSFQAFSMLFPCTGSTRLRLGERTVSCSRPQPAIYHVQDLVGLQRSAGSDNLAIFIDEQALIRRLFALTGEPLNRRLQFEPQIDLRQPSAAALVSFVGALESADIFTILATAPASARRMTGLLAEMVLEILPHNHTAAVKRQPGLIAPKHVKRTVEYIQANAHRGVSMEELVAISGVSLRALQYGFRRFLGVSLSEYERSVRLDRVRREIERGPGERVGAIARRWGFTNYTRFNAQFEAAFGVSAAAWRAGLADHI